MSKRKIIAFSLWGNKDIYTRGIIENLKIIPLIMPGWTGRVYFDKTVPIEIINEIKKYDAELVDMSEQFILAGYEKLFWRVLPLSDKNIERFISRDADCRVNVKEFFAIKEWEASNFLFHSMRDSVHHTLAIQGGLWGAKPCVENIENDIKLFLNKNIKTQYKDQYFLDQIFLNNILWPKIQDHCLCHTSGVIIGPHNKPFPLDMGKYYVGQILNSDNTEFDGNRSYF